MRYRDIASAPKDGTILKLLVQMDENPLEDDNSEPIWTIGSNNFENDDEDVWLFAGWCWVMDRYTQATGKVIGWDYFNISDTNLTLELEEAEDHYIWIANHWTPGLPHYFNYFKGRESLRKLVSSYIVDQKRYEQDMVNQHLPKTMELGKEFEKGVVLSVQIALNFGHETLAREILGSCGITPQSDLTQCAEYDLEALRKHLPEFANIPKGID